ncbi:unnamed protein product [Coregonus sp. 'balchen']|nr:unnamed protein product [Coregonus sp. 'balchen']
MDTRSAFRPKWADMVKHSLRREEVDYASIPPTISASLLPLSLPPSQPPCCLYPSHHLSLPVASIPPTISASLLPLSLPPSQPPCCLYPSHHLSLPVASIPPTISASLLPLSLPPSQPPCCLYPSHHFSLPVASIPPTISASLLPLSLPPSQPPCCLFPLSLSSILPSLPSILSTCHNPPTDHRFPAINNLIQRINLRKRRDSLILGGVIGICTILLLLYAFH